MSVCRVCMFSSLPVCLSVLRSLPVLCSALYSKCYHLFCSFLLFFKFNRHLRHGAYWCSHSLAHMSMLLFRLHLSSSNSCVRVSKRAYALTSSSIFIYIYRYIHMYICYGYSVLDTHILYIQIIIRLYVSVARRFAWCIHSCDLMFKGLYFDIHTYLYFLSIHACHIHIHELNLCIHPSFPSVFSSILSLLVPIHQHKYVLLFVCLHQHCSKLK